MASDLSLHCLPTSHKKDARLIWVKREVNTNFHLLRLVYYVLGAFWPSSVDNDQTAPIGTVLFALSY